MDTPERAAVRRALDSLKPHLAAFLAQRRLRVEDSSRDAGRSGSDIQALLKACLAHWETSLRTDLPRVARTYVHELIDVRNRWAHEESFSATESARAVDTVRMLGGLIGTAPAPVSPLSQQPTVPQPPTATVPRPSIGRRETQRDVMRRIFIAVGRDHERAIREYAAAERRGEARRKQDTYGISVEQYAKALLADGLKKGWLE